MNPCIVKLFRLAFSANELIICAHIRSIFLQRHVWGFIVTQVCMWSTECLYFCHHLWSGLSEHHQQHLTTATLPAVVNLPSLSAFQTRCRRTSLLCTSRRTYLTARSIPWTATTLTLCWWKGIPTDRVPRARWGWSCSSTSPCSAADTVVKTVTLNTVSPLFELNQPTERSCTYAALVNLQFL